MFPGNTLLHSFALCPETWISSADITTIAPPLGQMHSQSRPADVRRPSCRCTQRAWRKPYGEPPTPNCPKGVENCPQRWHRYQRSTGGDAHPRVCSIAWFSAA
eukprot:gene12271-biopygen22955